MSSAHLVQPGTLIDEKWEIIKLIGKENIHQPENDAVAIKIQTANVDSSVLKWEIQVLKSLQSIQTVPRFISLGQYENRDYLIMELLIGEVMSNLRNRIRSLIPSGLVPIQIASFLARQMLTSIRQLHAHGYVHRDIKPSNFVRKDFQSTKFIMIDFGLAKQCLDKDGTYRMRKEKTEFRGTTVYASPFVHEGEDQGPRDDLCSILHAFIDLIAGKLPWNEAAKNKDKVSVGHLKKRYYENLNDFISWIESQVHMAETNKMTSSESNFPKSAQEKLLEILTILKSMKNDEVPDYDRIEMLLYEAVPSSLRHDVSNLNYTFNGFSWRDTALTSASSSSSKQTSGVSLDAIRRQLSHGTPSTPGGMNSLSPIKEVKPLSEYFSASHKALLNHHNQIGSNQEDPNFFRIKNLYTRMRTLQRKDNNNSNLGETEIYSLALRWKNLVKELFSLPEQALTKELVELYYQVLIDYKYFYQMDLGTNNAKWSDFLQQQEIIALFLQLYDSIRKKEEEAHKHVEDGILMQVEEEENNEEDGVMIGVISDEEQLQQIKGDDEDNDYEENTNQLMSMDSMVNLEENNNAAIQSSVLEE